ncbi:MAG: hypothetical protein GXY25_17340, partial [Pirellulaceae bacterium]|nr:hypothetical protein [Pirellulaceae bacterium]
MVWRLTLLVGGITLLLTPSGDAQEALYGQLYGLGVHSYYSQDYAGAYEHLTDAIKSGSHDPRAYYFRGLSYLRLGREEEARMDFDKGAEFEADPQTSSFNVPRALERVQGADRLMLEEYRRKARAIALNREIQQREQRYGEIRAEQTRALRAQTEDAPEAPVGISAPAEGSNEDPFGVGAAGVAPAGPAAPVETPPATPPAPAEKPAAPAEKPAAAAKEPAAAADPFAAPAPAEKPAAAADPFAVPAPAEKPAAPAEKPAAPAKEPAAAADPFAAPAPA